ncbi:hemerythrin domain-containing protein [Nonomuraea glycinis]|jgi:hemerythrin superfamily protein|uniref:hemerythrin domain-containing protein n=1 Tax=Nonomuraea glycinis TaxID=2047744 RepID=UPI002E104D5E|nr:hemerythrin domain-containing protein [Nonomuraea glycinis]
MATDVITLITRDHRKVEELFARLTSGKGDPSATVAELHALLIAHARAEEDRVYPGIDAHHGLEEHKEAEVLLDALVRARPGTKEFRETLEKLVDSVNHHVEEEESELLPKLARQAGAKRLEELGEAFAQRRDEELRALNGGPLSEVTKAELYEQAQKADIPGRSQMDKEELEQALRQSTS